MAIRIILAHHIRKNINRVRIIFNAIVDCIIYYIAPRKNINISKDGYQTYLFLCHDLAPHFPRMVKWICRNKKLNPVLLVVQRGNISEYNIEYFSKVITYRSIWQLRQRLRDLKGYDLLYTTGAVAWPMRVGIEKSIAPVICDVKDTYIVNYGFNPPQLYMKLDLKNEKYTLEHSHGIVSQSIEAWFAYRFYGIQKRPPSLFFPLYCDDDYCVTNETKYGNSEVHLVYVGAIYGSSASKAHFGNEILFNVIDRFSAQSIHFHIYPSPSIRQAVIQEYKAYALKTPFLHIHDVVSQDALAGEISQYHFGLIPFFNERTKRLTAKRERSTTLKMFNYLEAGLPVIVSNHCHFQKWLISRYGHAIGIEEQDLDRLRSMIESLDYANLRKEALQKRQQALLSHHIPRLITFCDAIVGASPKYLKT